LIAMDFAGNRHSKVPDVLMPKWACCVAKRHVGLHLRQTGL
jgi:hypothetical protein